MSSNDGMHRRRIAINLLLGGRKRSFATSEIEHGTPPFNPMPHRIGQCLPRGLGTGELGTSQREAVQDRDFNRVEHRAAWRSSGVTHVAVPVFSGTADTHW